MREMCGRLIAAMPVDGVFLSLHGAAIGTRARPLRCVDDQVATALLDEIDDGLFRLGGVRNLCDILHREPYRLAVPEANPGLYVTMALAITFPFNIILGLPLYMSVINRLWH